MALTRAELIAAGIVIPGSSSAESFVPTGNTVPTNGLYLANTNTVALSTNSTGKLFVDANGRVGVGISPEALLHLSSATGSATPTPTELRIATTTNASDWSTTTPWGRLGFYSADASNAGPKTQAVIDAVATSTAGGTSSLRLAVSDITGALIDGLRITPTTLTGLTETTLYTSGNARLRITSAGRVGIGTNNPPQLLTVDGGNGYFLSSTVYSPQVIIENNSNDATGGYFILSKSRAGTRNLVGDNLGTLLWRATNFDNAMSNTNTSLICDVTETPTAAGLVRTALNINSDRFIRFSTINGEAARITDSNLLFIGHSSSQPVAQTGAKLEISGGDIGSVNIIRRSNNSFGANMYFAKSRNTTHNQYTILQNNDELGSIFFCGDDGTDFNHAGVIIRSYVDGAPNPIGTNKMPGGLMFMTNPGVNADDFAQSRMWITSMGHVGINAHPGEATLFRITGNGDGFGGYHNTVSIEPALYGTAASNEARCILTYPRTSANTSIVALHHILCAQDTFGAGTNVGFQIGIKFTENMTGATNNWGVCSVIPSNTKGAGGANTNYNLYIDGSAPSYFNSPVRIGNSSGRSNFFNSTLTSKFQIEGNGTDSWMSLIANDNSSSPPILIFGKQRSGTIGGNTIVANGDEIGRLSFQANDGAQFHEAARIQAYVHGTPGPDSILGRIVFSTNDGTVSTEPIERARITPQGYFKASDNATYVLTTGTYHEFNQSANNFGVYTTIRANSYTSTANVINYLSTATTNYHYIQCYSGNFSDPEFRVRGDGAVFGDGSYTVGADYAEYFEWADGNPSDEDRRGYPVVLEGGKIRKAEAGEEPIGVISSRPSVVGDAAPSMWSQKYLKDDFGAYLYEDKEVENEDGEMIIEKHKVLNPDYDPEQQYVSREDRPEWDAVGLVGKLRIRKGLPFGAKWIKLRDISDAVEEWLVR